MFYGVDAMSENAPELTPYHYTFNNPIILVDPDGNWLIVIPLLVAVYEATVAFFTAEVVLATGATAAVGITAYNLQKGNTEIPPIGVAMDESPSMRSRGYHSDQVKATKTEQIGKNRSEGARRHKEFEEKLKKENPGKEVLREKTLRDKNGK
jgi:hypothetical protein